MHTQSGFSFSSTCSRLNEAITDIRSQLSAAESNETLRASYEQKKQQHTKNAGMCAKVLEAIKPVTRSTKDYLADRKTKSLANINNALRTAGEVIPDAMGGIKFNIEGTSATIVDESGCPVDALEGGGFRQVSSALIQSVILQAAPEFLQTMFLDETFALVNAENSSTLSLCLSLLGKHMQIISIEQKSEIYGNVDYRCYTFSKSEKFSTVERTDYVTSEVN